MKLNKCLLGEVITQRREKNTGENLPIRGVSREGLILPKQQDADTSIYNVFYRKDFVFNPARMELNSIAYNDQFDKAICSSLYEVFYVNCENVILPEYLKLIVKRDWFTRYCEFLGSGSAREYCRFANICEIEIEFPEPEVQKRIVGQYKIVDDRIQILKKINDNLRAIAETIFLNDIRYASGSNSNLQETEIGTFPMDWEITTLGKVLDCIIDHRGLTPTKLGGEWADDGIIALSAKSVKNHELINLDIANHVDVSLFERWMPIKLQAQDILMTSEAPLGEFFYLADYAHYCLSQRLFALRANKSIIEPTLLYFQLNDTIGKHQIEIRKTGTTVSGIRQSELVKIPIVLPDNDVQKRFAKICNPIMLQIEKNACEIRQCDKLLSIVLAHVSSR